MTLYDPVLGGFFSAGRVGGPQRWRSRRSALLTEVDNAT